MVTPDEFDRVQGVVERRNRSVPHQTERQEFPLRSTARCAVCKNYVTGGFSKGRSKKYPYYRCDSRVCDLQPSYRTEVVDAEFGGLLDTIAFRPELVEVLKARIRVAAQKAQTLWKARRATKEAELARLDKEMQELIRMRAQDLVTDSEFIALRTTITGRQRQLADTTMSVRIDTDRIETNLEKIMLPLQELKHTWERIPVGFQRRFNHMVVPVGFVVGESRTAQLGPLFSVLGQSENANSREVALTGENLNRVYQAIQAFSDLFRDLEEEKRVA